MREIACYSASLFIGLSLGLIGAGGSILTIPAFVYIVRTDPVSATVYSMFVVGLSSLIGGVKAHVKKMVDLKMVFLFGTPSVIGVFISRRLIFHSIPDVIFSTGHFTLSKNILLMCLLTIVMSVASIKMLKSQPPAVDKDSEGLKIKTRSLIMQGFFVGMLTGLLGIGGGFLIVPALYLWAKVPMKIAIGTALLIITINALFGFLNSYTSVAIDWALLMKFSTGAVVGILIGAKLSENISGVYLKKLFGWILLFVSCFILFKIFLP